MIVADVLFLMIVAALASEASSALVQRSSFASQLCRLGINRLFDPLTYGVYPTNANASSPASKFFFIYQDNEAASKHAAVLVFHDLDPSARNCSIRWSIPSNSSNFGVQKSGLTDVYKIDLSRLPLQQMTSEVSYRSIAPYVDRERIGQADFTYWPQAGQEMEHVVGDVQCATSMAFFVEINERAEGAVILEQSDTTGWYLEFDC